jgi:hypothetical protein
MISTDRPTYRLVVAGHLDDRWADRFGELSLARRDDGTTTLTGPVVDQAQLFGILARLRDIGVPLLGLWAVDGVDDRWLTHPSAAPARDRGAPLPGGC